ncbi:MAG: rhodanese-like domain-containing protein [Candidatus Wallbacteria bacterium]|nr:rhodanese-like domain-containing protein [Candidatus Wallbacteria bacterium]
MKSFSPRKLFVIFLVSFTAGMILKGFTYQALKLKSAHEITVNEAKAIIDSNLENSNFMLLDVRTLAEYQQGHLKNAVNIDYYADFAEKIKTLNKDFSYVLYCRSGKRGKAAMDAMSGAGFAETYNMLGGILQWQAEGNPVVTTENPGRAAEISTADAADKIAAGNILLLDVRTTDEFKVSHLQNAVNLDYYDQNFSAKLETLDKTKSYIVYCRSGVRGGKAAEIMKKLGFAEAFNMVGGILKWQEEGRPVVTGN